MNLLPYQKFSIATPYSLPQLAQVMQAHVEPVAWLRWNRDHKEFQGTVSETGFEVTRIIHYRNSFMPRVRGRFEHGLGQTQVVVQLLPHPVTIIFMLFWFGIIGQVFFLALRGALQQGPAGYSQLLFPGGMLLFGAVMMLGGYWFEARKARRLLEEILGRPPSQPPPLSRA